MNESLSLENGRKINTGLAIEISTSGKSSGKADRIIADALFPAGTLPPAAGTRLIAVSGGKTWHGIVVRAKETAANSSFVRMKITAVPQGLL